MSRNCLLLVLLIGAGNTFAQQPFRLSFHHLTREEGLSNNNVFAMHRDSRGFLWLGTANGLNRYDGSVCRVYKPGSSAIVGVDIKNLVEDKSGNLWIGTEAGLNKYDRQKDDFENIPAPNGDENFEGFPYCIDNKGLLWVRISGGKSNALYTYDPRNKKYTFITDDVSINLPKHQNDLFGEVKVLFSGGKHDQGITKLTLRNNRVVKKESFLDGSHGAPAGVHIGENTLPAGDSVVWVTGLNEGLVRLNTFTGKVRIFNDFEGGQVSLPLTHLVKFGKYLIIGSGDGVYFFDTVSEKFVQVLRYSPLNSDGLSANWNEIPFIDRDQNLFISQLGFGVDFTNLKRRNLENWLTHEDCEQYGLNGNHVVNLAGRGDQTWARMQGKATVALDSKGKVIKYYEDYNFLFSDSYNRVWLSNAKEFLLVNGLNRIEKKISYKSLGIPGDLIDYMVETSPGEYLLGGNGLFVIRDRGTYFSAKAVLELAPGQVVACHPIHYDAHSRQVFLSAGWWADFYVLQKKSDNWVVRKKLDLPFQVFWVTSSIEPGKIWLCTNRGLILMDSDTFRYKVFTERDGLPDNVVNNIIPESNGDHWLVTNRGIAHYDSRQHAYRSYTSRDGANSKEYDWYGNFILPDGRVVFGGNNGLTVIDPSANQTFNSKPEVQITNFYADEKKLNEGTYIGERKEVELKSDQSTFGFDLVGIDFGFAQKLRIQYKLDKFDNQWLNASNPASVRYSNIPSGKYRFLVRAVDESGKASSAIRTMAVQVNAPFWRAVWFRAGLVLLLIGLGYTFFRLRLGQVQAEMKHKQELKHVRAQSEINALRSQMNPHFIFNCMNTIDSYIFLSKTEEASDFLQKFSKLVRKILEYSRQEYISVEEDLEALELYIQLEQERSNNSFIYEISVDHTLYNKEYLLPSMLFQPFVENAILHGLRHKRNDIGELYINLKMSGNQLICNIVDNGIGRAAAERTNFFRKHQRKSVGVTLTGERIQKINEIYPGLAYLKFTDLDLENDSGTIVEIGLPLLTQEELKS